jgi:D-xylose transport system permease protein
VSVATAIESPRASALRALAQQYALVLILVGVAIVFQIASDGLFISSRNVPLLLRQASVTAIVAAGVALVIIGRQIDLSIGSAVGLCGILAAWMMNERGVPVWATVALTLVAGLAMGLVQGAVVAGLGVPSFIVTLGGLLIFQGIGLLITSGTTIAGFPESFAAIGRDSVAFGPTVAFAVIALVGALLLAARAWRSADAAGRTRWASRVVAVALVLVATVTLIDPDRGLPVPVVIALVVTALLAAIARLTRFGRSLFAAGGNPVAAELAGISTRRVTLTVFGMMGALYAIAGMILIARIDGAPPDGASPLELDAIAAAVIGGTSLAGGTGSVSGAVLGAVLLASVSNGLDLVGVQSFWQLVATGSILIVAVLADVRLRGRS